MIREPIAGIPVEGVSGDSNPAPKIRKARIFPIIASFLLILKVNALYKPRAFLCASF